MMSSTNWKMIIRPFPNICARESDPCSYLPTFAGETIVTFVLDRCFIISYISNNIFTSVVLSLAVPISALNEES